MERITLEEFISDIQEDQSVLRDGHELGLIIDESNGGSDRLARTMSAIAEQELIPEAWGGDTITVQMAAQQNLGVDDLLSQLLVVAELEELTANPTGIVPSSVK